MKKWLQAASIVAVLSVPVVVYGGPCVASALEELNQQIVKILEPFQSPTTQAALVFKNIVTSSVRAESVAFKALYEKKGPNNTLAVKINSLSYDFDDLVDPTVRGRAAIELDLLKIFSQKELNELGDAAEDIAKEFAGDYASEYGAAATVTAKVTDKIVDKDGNLQSLTLQLAARIDLTKLPAALKPEDVSVKKLKIEAQIGVKGIAIAVTSHINPLYKGFEQDQVGLKEYLDKLLARDPELMAQITEMYQGLDGIATSIVSAKSESAEGK